MTLGKTYLIPKGRRLDGLRLKKRLGRCQGVPYNSEIIDQNEALEQLGYS
jgi:hypothetical protein